MSFYIQSRPLSEMQKLLVDFAEELNIQTENPADVVKVRGILEKIFQEGSSSSAFLPIEGAFFWFWRCYKMSGKD